MNIKLGQVFNNAARQIFAKNGAHKFNPPPKLNNRDNVIFESLDYLDKDIKDLILENYFIILNKKAYKAWQLFDCEDHQKKFYSRFKTSFMSLAEELQEIKDKQEIPNFFEALKNLKKEGRLEFRFYLIKEEWDRLNLKATGHINNGMYDGILNAVKLPAFTFKSDCETYYHELIHAIDDGKTIMKNGKKYNIDSDYLSTNHEVSDLAKKIDAYRLKMWAKWKTDFESFRNYKNKLRECNRLKVEMDCGRATKEEKEKYNSIKNECENEEKNLKSTTFWFYKRHGIDHRYAEFRSVKNPDIFVPHALENNRELIASALTALKYGYKEQRKMIIEDRELMAIIEQWKEFKPK